MSYQPGNTSATRPIQSSVERGKEVPRKPHSSAVPRIQLVCGYYSDTVCRVDAGKGLLLRDTNLGLWPLIEMGSSLFLATQPQFKNTTGD